MRKKALLALAAVGMTVASSQAAIDLSTVADSIETDLTSAQGLALPIFGVMFGITLVLSFFKRATH